MQRRAKALNRKANKHRVKEHAHTRVTSEEMESIRGPPIEYASGDWQNMSITE